jgi:integrase
LARAFRGLRRSRIDLEAGTVQVIEVITEPKGRLHFGPPKTSAGRRMVGLPRFVVDALAERLAAPGSPEELVFAGPQGGALRVTLFRRRFWLPAVKAAGLDGLRIHDLRHTAVALWIAAGANPKEVAARAGHASVSFTWTATATCTRRPTCPSASGWMRSGRPAGADRECSRPQRGPSRSGAASRPRSDGVAAR